MTKPCKLCGKPDPDVELFTDGSHVFRTECINNLQEQIKEAYGLLCASSRHTNDCAYVKNWPAPCNCYVDEVLKVLELPSVPK